MQVSTRVGLFPFTSGHCKAIDFMCGIAGVWNSQSADPAHRVDSMLASMRHRGPDGSGAISWPGGAAGMVRLALVDLSSRGQQPLWSPDRRVAIIFNGEMYNHVEHRTRLQACGYTFSSQSDTEVVLALYLERGLDFVDAVRGMFAVAVFDFREAGLEAPPKLVLARDPFGIKPLYYSRTSDGLVFASELRALLTSGLIAPLIDREALTDYLTFGFVLQPRTMLSGVQMLERGTLVVHSATAPPIQRRFWSMPEARPSGDDFRTAATKLRSVLEESVRLHSLADTPVGAFLSGGVDSSAIVAMMSKHNPKLRTYTVRFTDARYDESHYARAFAAGLGTVHTEVEIADAELPKHFERFCAGIDQPSADGLNTWLVSEAAHRDVKAVLSGLGGDEWFGGYPVTRRMAKLGSTPAKRLVGRAAGLAQRMLGGSSAADQLARVAARAGPLQTWAAGHRIFLPGQVGSMVGAQVDDGASRLEAMLGSRLGDSDPVDQSCQLDVWAFMGCQLLRDSDVTSMASSLELRVPMVDIEVARAARSISPRFKVDETAVPPSKRVLVEAVRDLLPPDIDSRPKRGFALPFGDWLAGPLREISNDSLASLRRRRLIGREPEALEAHQRWALVILEGWCRQFLDTYKVRSTA